MYTRFLREANPGDGGGGLQNLVNELGDNIPDITDPPEGGKTDDQIKEADAAAQTALKAEALNADGTVKPGYIKADDGTISKDANYQPAADEPEEGVDENGNLLPGYKKDAEGKVIVDPDYKPTELTPEEEAAAFFERVNAITGDTDFVVEYPEGVSPLSPEGIAHYTAAVREDAAIAFEEYLAQKDPRAWAYMLHRAAGKPDDEFLGNAQGFVLPSQEDFDKSADLQASILRYDLKAKGNDDESVEFLVKKAIADNKLKEKADIAYKYINEEQQKELAANLKATAEKDIATDKAIGTFVGKVDKAIAGELKFIVPEQDKGAFRQFVIDNLRYDEGTGTFSVVQKIADDQLNTVLESLFFQHKKGNLKSLIEKQAKTIASQTLKLKLTTETGGPGSGKGANKSETGYIPLSEMTQNNS